jgi:hypothetical protein
MGSGKKYKKASKDDQRKEQMPRSFHFSVTFFPDQRAGHQRILSSPSFFFLSQKLLIPSFSGLLESTLLLSKDLF